MAVKKTVKGKLNTRIKDVEGYPAAPGNPYANSKRVKSTSKKKSK